MLATDVPVLLHNSTRGLLSLDDGRLDVLQLSSDGRRECLALRRGALALP